MTLAYVTRAGHEQRIAWIGGSVHRIVLDATATEGRTTAVRSTMRGCAASPVHVHEHDDETVFVLSRSGVFWAGDDRWELKSGDTAFLPRRLQHTYLFTSDQVELLTICNPAGIEDFFRAAGWDLANPKPEDWAVDIKSLAKIGQAAGQIVLGPPLALDDRMPRGTSTVPDDLWRCGTRPGSDMIQDAFCDLSTVVRRLFVQTAAPVLKIGQHTSVRHCTSSAVSCLPTR